ncbi:MAG: hypothetical protein QGD88_12730 [Anaerolineae bacterium]|nr:hypothetical protein [Anaerolineae bacterium]MDK1082325.1 hypothetical protein [Anaerolineae bacterium]
MTFVISWGIFIGIGILADSPESPIIIIAVYGPMLAAIILTGLIDSGAGLKNLLQILVHWRIGIRWYLIVVLGSFTFELLAHRRI